MSNDKKKLPYGLREINKKGEKELSILFPAEFKADVGDAEALKSMSNGKRGKFVVTGRWRRGAFCAESVDFLPDSSESAVDERWCPLVTEALEQHLEYGDPQEGVFVSREGALTAARVLEMLLARDPRVLRFVEDVHGAALRAVRVRRRKPPKGLG